MDELIKEFDMNKHNRSPNTRKYELAAADPKTRVRFVTMFNADPDSGCWNWAGIVNERGYGIYQHWHEGLLGVTHGEAFNVFAHRVSLHLAGRPVPEDRVTDHLCNNTRCINPDHLAIVTDRENILRGNGAGARNARKTHCVHGHAFAGDNLRIRIVRGRPARICIACVNRNNAEARGRKQRVA